MHLRPFSLLRPSAVLLFLLLSVCRASAQPGNAQKGTVVNGQYAGNGYPFFCSLTAPNGTAVAGFSPECGASLIAPQWVLTAGHCVIDLGRSSVGNEHAYDSLDVIIAPNIIAQPGAQTQRVRADYIVMHRSFQLFGNDLSNDIALLHLRTPVTNVAPIALPAQGDNSLNQAGAAVTGIGYGLYDTLTFASPDTLLMVNIEIIHNDTCNAPNHYDGEVGPGMICAGVLTGRATGNSAGDSGGPLFVDNGGARTQVGVVSWGNGAFANADFPGVYTRVSAYRAWIDSVISAHDHPTAVGAPGRGLAAAVTMQHGVVTARFAAPLSASGRCQVYDMTGKVIASAPVAAGAASSGLPLSALAQGIYCFRILLQDGRSYSTRLPVQD